MAKKSNAEENVVKPNVFMRIGLFIKQIIDELRKVVTPTRKELVLWSIAVFIFVIFLMLFVTGLDFGLGKLVMLIFG
ncbi:MULTISPECIES: preprotein translocase subunit SecE [Bifidobacterium]|uniref:Protein translocase subunit SecE n=1 Tax=Bifidobacterium tissieri TaxID=1630162 RepID=A0A261FHZ6_9BIFI|nr:MULTISPECIES: preprotein translocase subunit SecE [Bifidobacterium]KAA8831222.1 preprotein translocase subunit SecE [Bifidobacterium tissieri]KAA8833124.1 preprotein translocase subunit SecE [Bifidobacterium tissieri]OZG58688.1 preprotein translocase subunit SecE [Bifidobacterium tissieri]TPF97842.1 preprotein translocase subunit SecE [Bifidobacterium sp. UTCIF-39]